MALEQVKDFGGAFGDYFSPSTAITVGGLGGGYILGSFAGEAVKDMVGLSGWTGVAVEGAVKLGAVGLPIYAFTRDADPNLRTFGIGMAAGTGLSVLGDVLKQVTGNNIADIGAIAYDSMIGGSGIGGLTGGSTKSKRTVVVGERDEEAELYER